eukprot:CAMPEP_0177669670 /NCGR_PEP_ID=MMETSP0447-20121125/23599_1 /TAXON_ID=0 /ORGANISM="Stygamoeba regulata, Strain BSH-02190019" /LENGTH=362 /DNA_ID=CAMNT_0019176621 /DNA_START=418 /DNA_END=1506 /DNA_ORIENTATION=+
MDKIETKEFLNTLGMQHVTKRKGRKRRHGELDSDDSLGGEQRMRQRSRSRCLQLATELRPECYFCGATDSPEWRRGPDTRRTLCNACGLLYRKKMKERAVAARLGKPKVEGVAAAPVVHPPCSAAHAPLQQFAQYPTAPPSLEWPEPTLDTRLGFPLDLVGLPPQARVPYPFAVPACSPQQFPPLASYLRTPLPVAPTSADLGLHARDHRQPQPHPHANFHAVHPHPLYAQSYVGFHPQVHLHTQMQMYAYPHTHPHAHPQPHMPSQPPRIQPHAHPHGQPHAQARARCPDGTQASDDSSSSAQYTSTHRLPSLASLFQDQLRPQPHSQPPAPQPTQQLPSQPPASQPAPDPTAYFRGGHFS